jgi:hypothetical protein
LARVRERRGRRPLWAASGLALLLFPLCCAELGAQTRPLLSEEAYTHERGRLVVEIGQSYVTAQPNFLTGEVRDRWDGPLVRLVYSPADSVEMDLEWTSLIVAVDDVDYGTKVDAGDVVLRTKLRLVEESGGWPAVAARYELSLPNTSMEFGLGPDALRMSAQLLVSRTLGPVRLHLNGGLAIQDEPLAPHAQNDFLDYGLAIEHRASDAVALLGEVTGLAGPGSPGAEERSEARLGLRLGRERLRLDVAVRRGLAEADGDWGFSVGLTWQARGASTTVDAEG